MDVAHHAAIWPCGTSAANLPERNCVSIQRGIWSMRLRRFRAAHEPGFRLSLVDLIVLAGLCALSAWMRHIVPDHGVWLLPVYVGGSFFLFCNVFRVGNRVEAFWYVPFVVCVAVGLLFPGRLWWIVLSVCEPVRVAVIAYRIVKGPYVGVFSRLKGGGQ